MIRTFTNCVSARASDLCLVGVKHNAHQAPVSPAVIQKIVHFFNIKKMHNLSAKVSHSRMRQVYRILCLSDTRLVSYSKKFDHKHRHDLRLGILSQIRKMVPDHNAIVKRRMLHSITLLDKEVTIHGQSKSKI